MRQPLRLLVAATFLLTTPLAAQNLTAPVLSGSWQSTYHNPTMHHFLPTGVTVGLPGVANDLRLENVRYADLFVNAAGERLLSLEALAALTEDRNGVEDVFSLETLGLAVRGDRWAFGAYHRLRTEGAAEYRGALVDLAAFGNAPFIGATVEIAPRGTIQSFHEVGLGVSYALSGTVAVGGRIKYLAGTSAVTTTDAGSLRLTTGTENYALTLEQDITLQTARAVRYGEDLNTIQLDYRPYQLRAGDLFGGNRGVGIDLGVAMNLDRLRLNASVTDLAAGINWKEEVTSLRFTGTNTFTGADVLRDLLRDSVSLATAVDSLVSTFNPQADAAAFRTEVAPSFYLGGEYDLNDRFTLGALLVIEDRLDATAAALALTGRYTVTDWLRVGLNVNHRAGYPVNAGVHLYATPGQFRLFVASDKLISLLASGSPAVSGIRIGASLALGSPERSSASFRPEYR
ncbi:DUF5723 family protein [Lewinella sp. IMCC34183]|uniref:DUF5723 family protein n=1 Tax=Lewinella sp. IMCC34183 TaxID=2248762 RepID=UPI000E24DF95|nr:DUF5723 family protein [Lewinella sp. IMCC34183]